MQFLKSQIKKIGRIILDLISLTYGLLFYAFNQKKPLNQRTAANAHLSLIRLFCLTSGFSNDLLSKCISLFDKPISLPNYHGILGDFTKDQVEDISTRIRSDGFYVFNKKLPADLIKSLYHYASIQDCIPRRMDNDHSNAPLLKTRYDKHHLLSSVYDFSLETTLANGDVQALLRDNSILAVAQSYLQSSPKVDVPAFWWSTPFSNKPQENSAQLFHFDMDRIKWIKFFIFLTDVTIENGPHVFIRKSHKTGNIPRQILKAGYSRHPDETIYKFYPKEDIQTFVVPAGTILAEDTRGLHKGTNLIRGERLVLELQFSNSLFGAITSPIQELEIRDTKLWSLSRNHPALFKLYSFKNS